MGRTRTSSGNSFRAGPAGESLGARRARAKAFRPAAGRRVDARARSTAARRRAGEGHAKGRPRRGRSPREDFIPRWNTRCRRGRLRAHAPRGTRNRAAVASSTHLVRKIALGFHRIGAGWLRFRRATYPFSGTPQPAMLLPIDSASCRLPRLPRTLASGQRWPEECRDGRRRLLRPPVRAGDTSRAVSAHELAAASHDPDAGRGAGVWRSFSDVNRA